MGDKVRDQEVARLAGQQHGVVSIAQLRSLGLDRRAVAKRARAGRLHRVHRGVYAVGHQRLTFRGHCLAAVLACSADAAVSHRSAAALWRLLPPEAVPIHVTAPGRSGRRARPGIVSHASTSLDGGATAIHGIPVTRPARTLQDIKRTGPRHLYLQVFRRAIDLRLIEPPAGPADELTRSELERRFLALCRRHRLPVPEINARIGGIEVDFLWRDQGLVIETDGFRFHGDRTAFEADRVKDAELQSRGLRVLRLTYRQVLSDASCVAATIRRMLGVAST